MQSTSRTSKAHTMHRYRETPLCPARVKGWNPLWGRGEARSPHHLRGQRREQSGQGAAAPTQTHRADVGPMVAVRFLPPPAPLCVLHYFRSCSFVAVGPQGREQRSHFDLQLRRGEEGQAERKEQCLQNTTIAGNFPPALRGRFFSSIFLFFY